MATILFCWLHVVDLHCKTSITRVVCHYNNLGNGTDSNVYTGTDNGTDTL